MRLLVTLALISLFSLTSTTHAAVLKYDFAGAISQSPSGTTITPGDAFSGSWVVESDQVGAQMPGQSGRQYALTRLTINLGGDTLDIQNAGALTIGEIAVHESLRAFWPSGYASDYVVTSFAIPDLPRWGTSIWRFGVLFSYDGLGIWNEFSLPTGFAFLESPVMRSIHIDTIGTHPGSGVDIFGKINTISVSEVPLAPASLFFGAPSLILLLATRVRT